MYSVERRNSWLPSIFSNLFDDDFTVMPARQFASPAVNIKESEKEFQIEIAAPKKNKKEEKDDKGTTYLRREFSYTSYHQSFTLPENINLDAIRAEIVNGVLRITLPKLQEVKQVPASRQIEVK